MVYNTADYPVEEELYFGKPLRVLDKSGKKSGKCWNCLRTTVAVYIVDPVTGKVSHSSCKYCGARLGGWGDMASK